MFKSLSRSEVRQLDADAIRILGLPSLLLMENAARGVSDEIIRSGPWDTITIIAGPGNNGGDGLAIARQLSAAAINSITLLIRVGKRLSVDAAENLRFLQSSQVEVKEPLPHDLRIHCESLTERDLIVDALLGTGIQGTLDSPFAEIIHSINSSSARVISVDVPSGLDCDLGLPSGECVRAHTTVTFVAQKHGFLQPAANEFTGTVRVCHIGIPQRWLEQWYRQFKQGKAS